MKTRCDLCDVLTGETYTYKRLVPYTPPKRLVWKWEGDKPGFCQKVLSTHRSYLLDEDCIKDIEKRIERERQHEVYKSKV